MAAVLEQQAQGARILLESAHSAGVEVCFANPGTTEMPLVEALDACPGVRAVLGLFEGVCTGAADGYGRMLGKPALTLLHLGPGFANGIANLHNARRARSPIVNVIGDHASWHLAYDAPLTSDIESLARPVSGWLRTIAAADDIARDTAEAVAAASSAPSRVATLVFPVDFQQASVNRTAPQKALATRASQVPSDRIERIARLLQAKPPAVILLGGNALSAAGQRAAARIGKLTGAALYSETFPARAERGGGLPDIDRLPYFPEPAMAALGGARHVILAGALDPVAYFGYPGLPSRLAPEGSVIALSGPEEDSSEALERLAAALGARADATLGVRADAGIEPSPHDVADGVLSPQSIGRLVSNALPDDAIVSVEGGTCGYPFFTASARARRHTVLTNTGGAIGQGLPCALGAAIACPERRVVALQSDGSAQYTLQSLWTMAREQLPVTMLIVANRRYGILQSELARAGITQPGVQARRLTELDHPAFDWQALARGYGVPSVRVAHNAGLRSESARSLAEPGPRLIEMVL